MVGNLLRILTRGVIGLRFGQPLLKVSRMVVLNLGILMTLYSRCIIRNQDWSRQKELMSLLCLIICHILLKIFS